MSALVIATTRDTVANYVSALFLVYSVIIVIYVLSSLIFSLGVRVPYSRWSDAVLGFLRRDVPSRWSTLCDSVTDNFRIISPGDFRVLR